MENEPATYRFDTSEGYQQAMEQLQYADTVGGDAVLGVWIAGVKNSQVIQSDGYISDASFDVTERIWYQLPLSDYYEHSVPMQDFQAPKP